jgi:hypothetical protein
MIGVLRPSGCAPFSVWVPAGPIDAVVGTFGRAIAAATGSSRDRLAWHDAAAVGELTARHDAQVRIQEGQLSITGASSDGLLRSRRAAPPYEHHRPSRA